MNRIWLAMVLLISTAMPLAADFKFTGEVFAGRLASDSMGELTSYWVFDGPVFHEYLMINRTGELRHMVTGTYEQHVDIVSGEIRYDLSFPRASSGAEQGTIWTMTRRDTYLKIAPGKFLLKMPESGARSSSAVLSSEPIIGTVVTRSRREVRGASSAESAGRVGILAEDYQGGDTCCDACWAVHESLCIHVYDCLCCGGYCHSRWPSVFQCALGWCP